MIQFVLPLFIFLSLSVLWPCVSVCVCGGVGVVGCSLIPHFHCYRSLMLGTLAEPCDM